MKFKSIITAVGATKLANATAKGTQVKLKKMALGDGGGQLPEPDAKQTALIKEVYRDDLNSVSLSPDHDNWVVCELIIPAEVGGWTIREVGLYDEDDDLISVGNFPETYKPKLDEGSGKTQTIRVVIQVTSSDSVEFLIDPSTVLATVEYVNAQDEKHAKEHNNPHQVTKEQVGLGNVQNYEFSTSVSEDSDEKYASAGAVKKAYELANSKWTEVVASLTKAGITQLSSSLTSNSEKLAATPKAVKTAMDKANAAAGAASKAQTTADAKVNKSDDWMINAKLIGSASNVTDLNNINTPGFYRSSSAANKWLNLPSNTSNAFMLEVISIGSTAYTRQILRAYSSLNTYERIKNGDHPERDWSDWYYNYNEQNKPSLDDLGMSSLLDKMFPVGHLLTTFNTANPSAYGYPGTWTKVDSDLTLMFGSTPNQKPSGTNTPTVPVPLHHHDATFSGDEMEEHNHIYSHITPVGHNGNFPLDGNSYYTNITEFDTSSASAGTPSGTVTIDDAGTADATIDVRGKHIVVIGWIRTK